MLRTLAVVAALTAGPAVAQTEAARRDLAPTGTLRAAINFGNPVLAQRDPAGGEPRGVSAVLAREVARRLGVPATYVPYEAAGAVTDANKAAPGNVWDVAFLAVDPTRAQEIAYTAPYAVIEGIYAVRDASPIRANEDVDRPGIRISVGRGSAYDLFLTRAIRQATLVRSATSAAAIEDFARDPSLDVVAGVGQPIRGFAASSPGHRVLPGRFMVIEQAVATPRGREAGLAFLREVVEEAKASGLVARVLEESGQRDAEVAPAAR
ncbi:transporter substrate-binding domain-containing protein [Roseomonas sp. CCTCC AB2023176]|uniref:transporter substrate-binding domain-containing protein n=1 Tax=Roseomonas sp. CCTCC AB2023176 TaxID=3342640 RepID=UPI0035DF1979